MSAARLPLLAVLLTVVATTAAPVLRHKLAANLPSHASDGVGGAEMELPSGGAGRGRKLVWCIVDCNGCSGGKPENACQRGYECVDNTWPTPDSCRPKGCLSDGCQSGYECDDTTTRCKPTGCLANGCLQGYVCDTSSTRCEPTGCLKSGCDQGYECDEISTMCKPKGCIASGCERGYECDKYSTECKPQGCLASGCPSNSECDKTTLECKENKPLSVTEAPASPAAASAPALPCKDDDKNCEFWAAAGECTKNPAYMLQTCKLSCRAPGCPAPPVLPPAMEAPAITAAPAPSPGPADAPAPAPGPADPLAPALPVV